MQKISPFLWFDAQAEEAAKHYTAIFKNSRITKTTYYPEGSPAPAGQVMTVEFELDGQRFTALNGGPQFKFNESVSFVVPCETQAEIDEKWEKLAAGGSKGQCGWLKDKFGLSWQIVPSIMGELFEGQDKARSERIMQALLRMTKLDIDTLKNAAAGN